MKIGVLNGENGLLCHSVETMRTGGRLPFPADSTADGLYRWGWQKTMLTGVEFRITFETEVFAASVCLKLQADSALTRAEIWTETESVQRCVGSRSASEGESFGGEVKITTAARAKTFVVRLFPAMKNLVLPEPAIVGAALDEPVLFPTPSSVTWGEGTLPLCALACAASDDHADSVFALAYFRERMAQQWGLHAADGAPAVRFVHTPDLPTEGYRLTVTPDSVLAEAGDRLGILYAAERILELCSSDGVPACVIDDAPFQKMRGFHFGLPARDQIPFVKEFLRTILIPCHYNHLILEFAGGMRFDSHPEISEGWLKANELAAAKKAPAFPHGTMVAGGKLLEKDEVRDLCDFARELGFEVIPEVQSLGHVQYITYSHPEIAELDESVTDRRMDTRDTDQPPSTFYHHSYCPQNALSYKIIFDLIDEIVDVVRPRRFVHMGHDEVYQLGICPKCKKVPRDQLLEKHLLALHGYLKQKGLRMMIWADMLQPASSYRCYPALTRLPRDIVLLDFIWYFHFDKDIEKYLLPYGYDVMVGNLYSSHFPRYESRIRQSGMIGGQISTWVPMNEAVLAREGKMYDTLYTAEMLWSDRYTEDARTLYAQILSERIPALRERIHGRYGVPAPVYEKLLLPAAPGFVPAAVREACPGSVRISESVEIPVNRCATALRFTNTTVWEGVRIAWEPLVDIGAYTVIYEDGTEVRIPLLYDGNIRRYTHRFAEPKGEQYYRHEGYVATWMADPAVQTWDENGDPVTILSFTWENPHPEKKIARIIAAEAAESPVGAVLCGVEAGQ